MPSDPGERNPYEVHAERTIYTFAYLHEMGRHALRDGAARSQGSFYEWMTASVFAAFALEAYVNHLGSQRLKCWKELERSPWSAKLALLLEHLNQSPDRSFRPFQTVKEMFRFRDRLAHGRTERVENTGVQKLLPGERPHYPQAGWESQCTEEMAIRFMDDARAVIVQLHEWAGLDTTLLFALGEGGSTTSAINTAGEDERSGKDIV